MGKVIDTTSADPTDQEWATWAEVMQELGTVTGTYQDAVAIGLYSIQSNTTDFIAWSQKSGLSAGIAIGSNGLDIAYSQALNTYSIAQIITDAGLITVRAPNTDVHFLQTNGTQLAWDPGCDGGYDINQVCGTFFFDGKDTYGLVNPADFTQGYNGALDAMFANSHLTTGYLLFSGAEACNAAKSGQNGGQALSFDLNAPNFVDCLSNLQVCDWDMGGYGPFTNCVNSVGNAALPAYGIKGCDYEGAENNGNSQTVNAPVAYLGIGIVPTEVDATSLSGLGWCVNVP